MWAKLAGATQAAAQQAAQAAQAAAAEATTAARRAADAAVSDLEGAMETAGLRRAPSGAPPPPPAAVTQVLDYTYVTDRVIAMGYPSDKPHSAGEAAVFVPLHALAGTLHHSHRGHFMVWNLSEQTYDYSVFGNQVLEFKFPGHPAPPLGLLFKMCSSIDSWLSADGDNVAVVHCLTGKGRTATVVASLLAWQGAFGNASEALDFVAQRRRVPVERLTIPSQRRYLKYFSHMLDGVRPRSSALLLRRVIINGVPVFDAREGADGRREEGCAPYLQVFKNGKLVFTSVWQQEENKWAFPSDGSVAFGVDCILQGDVLIRCRHAGADGKKRSMFRAAFHTGYVASGILRLTKRQLDGACQDDRFADDFFVDVIFAPVGSGADAGASVAAEREGGVSIDPADQPAYDAMLQHDRAFWQQIAERKAKLEADRAAGAAASPAAADRDAAFAIGVDDSPARDGTDDLLEQIDALGLEDDDFSAVPASPTAVLVPASPTAVLVPASPTSSSVVVEEPPPAPAPSAVVEEEAPPTPPDLSPSLAPATTEIDLDADLAELAALEAELGMGGSAPAAPVSLVDGDGDDGLADLEEYLDGFAPSS